MDSEKSSFDSDQFVCDVLNMIPIERIIDYVRDCQGDLFLLKNEIDDKAIETYYLDYISDE